MLLLVACLFFPLLSLALPFFHSFRHRSSHLPRVMTYYPGWAPQKSLNHSLFDVILFAFAVPDENFQLRWDSDQASAILAKLVLDAHSASSFVMLSIGGWTGSRPVPSFLANPDSLTLTRYFSDAVATPRNRATFINNILDAYIRYDLDGIDIDWEYPGQVGLQGNGENAADSTNMFQFCKELQKKLPPGAMISAAVQDFPFAGADGRPMKDVSSFSHVLDWITLMNYDVYQMQQPPGPNAPLFDGCHNSSQPNVNAVGAYNAWTSAGFPASKIVLGVPSYGYIVEPNSNSLSDHSLLRAYSEDGSGQVQFQSLVTQGVLVQSSDGSFQGSRGFVRRWDSCSATPFLYSNETRQVIPYDDSESLGIKAAWVRRMRMGGVNLFDAHGDTTRYDLTHALRAALLQNNAVSTTISATVHPSASSPYPTTSLAASSVLPSSSQSQPTPPLSMPGGIARSSDSSFPSPSMA